MPPRVATAWYSHCLLLLRSQHLLPRFSPSEGNQGIYGLRHWKEPSLAGFTFVFFLPFPAVIANGSCTGGRGSWGEPEPCRAKIVATVPLAAVLSRAGGRKPVLSVSWRGLSSHPRPKGVFLTYFINLSNFNVSVKLAYSITKPVCSRAEFCTWKTLY